MVVQIHQSILDSPTVDNSHDVSSKILVNRVVGSSNKAHSKKLRLLSTGVLDGIVTFSEKLTVGESADYSLVPKENCWYTLAQLYLIQIDTKKCVVGMDNFESVDSSWGLENWTNKGKAKLQKNLAAATEAVLDGNADTAPVHQRASSLASNYSDACAYAKILANSRGMKLEQENRAYALDIPLHLSGTTSPIGGSTSGRSHQRVSIISSGMSRSSSTWSILAPDSPRQRSSRCKAAMEEVRMALVSARRLGLHGIPNLNYKDNYQEEDDDKDDKPLFPRHRGPPTLAS